jgi:hypothetical protein
MSEGQWHRLDNIFAIQCFSTLFVYLAAVPDVRTHLTVNFLSLGITIVTQEKDPWNVLFTVVPVVTVFLGFVSVVVLRYVCIPFLLTCWSVCLLSSTFPVIA